MVFGVFNKLYARKGVVVCNIFCNFATNYE